MLFKLIKIYRFDFLKIFLYEIFHIFAGFKGNSYKIRNDDRVTDNIPCPYFFLSKIKSFIKEKKIKTFIDLGCGSGRSIYFLNRKYKINYIGIEYFEENYTKCQKLFEKYENVAIINNDFMKYDFLKLNADCYFINDPLKNFDEFNELISKIINKSHELNKEIFFILVNLNKEKLKLFDKYKLLDSININTRGFYIYSNNLNK